ncbi:MAG: hypothetical protein WC455_19725 [Dehalococcoidia bacterium]|jgi:hypothetical protein
MSLIQKASGSTLWSGITIDADKDMGAFGLTNLKELCAAMNPGDIIAYDAATGRLAAVPSNIVGTQLLTKGTHWPPVWGFPDTGDIGTSVYYTIAAAANDSEGSGAVYNNAAVQLRAGNNAGSTLKSALRFVNINIPAHAMIYSAFIGFTCNSSRAAQVVNSILRGELSAAPAAYGAAENFTARAYTVASKVWTPGASWTLDAQYSSGVLTAIVQELVNTYGAYVNGTMAFQWLDNGSGATNYHSAYSYDASALKAPVLVIRYGVV